MNIDGKSLTASKSALNDYKTAIEQLPDSETLKHDCLERAQQCRKDAEAEVAEHQQELARQQEVFAEMEREIPQVQTSIGTAMKKFNTCEIGYPMRKMMTNAVAFMNKFMRRKIGGGIWKRSWSVARRKRKLHRNGWMQKPF